MAYLDTPDRVLKRVQQLEMQELDLPSLPSFQHDDLDFESGSMMSGAETDMNQSANVSDRFATPHPLRKAPTVSSRLTITETARSIDTSHSSIGSPFPPLPASLSDDGNSPYAPGTAVHSTPQSMHSKSRRFVSDNETRSTLRYNGSIERRKSEAGTEGNVTGRERWHTPGEMSGSFSGDEIPHKSLAQDSDDLEEGITSLPLADVSNSFDNVAETPLTRRLSNSKNVLFQRPGRKSAIPPGGLPTIASSPATTTPASFRTAILAPDSERVPSLSRSEITQSSGGASTPEGPSQRVGVVTPRSATRAGQEGERDVEWDDAERTEDLPTLETEVEQTVEAASPSQRRVSPGKTPKRSPERSVAGPSTAYSTPGMARDPASSPNYHGTPDFGASVLQDVTAVRQNLAHVPFTPSPLSNMSKMSDISTPRAPLNDAERRKSHVLAVLNSGGLPARAPRAAFRGTPHPLRRVSMPPSSPSISEEPSEMLGMDATPRSQTHLSVHSQPANESFVSIASSADLTSDRRAVTARHVSHNTSFPTLLLPTDATGTPGSLRGGGDRRADGVKIHKHLNAMNKQLLESNADLAREAEAWRNEVERLAGLMRAAGMEWDEVDVMANISQVSRDGNSIAPTDGERSMMDLRRARSATPGNASSFSTSSLDKMTQPELLQLIKEMVDRLATLEIDIEERDALIADLEQRSGEGSSHANEEVESLRAELEESERARNALHDEFAQKTEQHAKRFGDICGGFEEQVKGLERQLGLAKAEADRLRADKARLESLASKGSMGEREIELRKQMAGMELDVVRAKEESRIKGDEIESYRKQKEALQSEKLAILREKEMAKARLAEVEQQLANELEQHQDHDADQAELDEKVAEVEKVNQELEAELERQNVEIEELLCKVEELESAQDDPQAELAQEIDDLRRELETVVDGAAAKDEELESLRARLEAAENGSTSLRRSHSEPADASRTSYVVAVEERLDEAYREIGRLKHEITATPHRKTAIETRDARIKALEREKASLLERLNAAKATVMGNSSMPSAASPFGRPTPFVHRAIASLKTPKTPGPLKDLSWLQSTISENNEPVFKAQIEYLQGELKKANDQLDNNFSRLEAAGFSGLALAKKLAAAQARIAELEDELRSMIQNNKASLASGNTRPDKARDDARLKVALEAVHEQLEIMQKDSEDEKRRWHSENGRLQDLVSELRLKSRKEAESFQAEVERLSAEVDADVQGAKREATVLSEERDSLRRDLRNANNQVRDLQRDLSTHRTSLEDANRRLARVSKDVLSRSEQNRRSGELERLEESLRQARATSSSLQRTVEDREAQLRQSQARVAKLEQERQIIAGELMEFEKDLEAQQRESAAFGRELELLKAQQSHGGQSGSGSEVRQIKEKLRGINIQLDNARSRADELERWRREHECQTGEAELEEQRLWFKSQSRDLASQIKYLKAKYTREASFRNALALQKRYLLLLVGGMSLNEQATLKAIASMGFPTPSPPRKRISLKSVAIAVMSVIRARDQAARWRDERELKADAVANHERRRKISGR